MSRFHPNDVVWAKNAFRRNAFWPALVVDAEQNAPLSVRKSAVPGRCCLMFYGPSKTSNRSRDWYWREEDDILPWIANIETLKAQQLSVREQFAFNTAISEAQGVINNSSSGFQLTDDKSQSSACLVCQKSDGGGGRVIRCRKCQGMVHVNCDVLTRVPKRAEVRGMECVYFCPSCREGLDPSEVSRFSIDYGRELQNFNPGSIHSESKSEAVSSLETKEAIQLYSLINTEYLNLIEHYQRVENADSSSNKRKYIKTSTLIRRSISNEGLDPAGPRLAPQSSDLEQDLKMPNEVSPLPKQRKLDDSKSEIPTNQNPMLIDQELLEKDIKVVCNGVNGIFHFSNQRVSCECEECLQKSNPEDRIFTATHFEQHCGAGTAKKWKASVRIRPGSVPEVSESDPPLPLGRWFAMKGIDMLIARVPATNRKSTDVNRSVGGKQRATQIGSFKDFDQVSQVEVKPWDHVRVGGYMKLHVRYASDRCSVCDADIDYDCDQLISCDKCGLTVHQTCYGVHETMSSDKIWLCNVCKAQGTENAECCLCPIVEGARKPTTIDGLWAHVACMQWIPEVTVENPLKMERISRIEYIQKERWDLNCCFCKQKMGAKIQCAACYTAYHPLCARIAGMYMEMKDGPEGSSGPLDLVTYCPRHAKPHPELSGIKLVLDQDEEESRISLFNRQPYPEPSAVEVPVPKTGCARTEDPGNWNRQSHGTGSGSSSNTGFWIPIKPPSTPPGLDWRTPHGVTKGKRGKGGGSRRKGEDLKNEDLLTPVELIPLPEGVPESVKVECNGFRGVFLTRSQRVVHMTQTIPAAKFEQLCGRGDAKKWKASLWFVNELTEKPECQMHVWLAKWGLDRNTLAKLQTNQSEVESYNGHLTDQIGLILDEIMTSISKAEDPMSEIKSSPVGSPVPEEEAKASGGEVMGQEVISWSGHREEYVHGKVTAIDPDGGDFQISYENGDLEWTDSPLDWDSDHQKWTLPQSQDQAEEADEEKVEEEVVVSTGTVPEKTEVICNGITATFVVKEMMIISNEGLQMTPRDFERAAGKGASKKWKNSIKVKRPDGRGCISVGDWLAKNGCITQKVSSSGFGRSRNSDSAKKCGGRVRDCSWIPPKHRRQRHQSGCLCIVCRQSKRRTSSSGLTGRLDPTSQRVEPWQPATTLASVRAQGPGIRYGKRAFIEAVPHLVGGVVRHEPQEIPTSKSWTVEKWMMNIQKKSGLIDSTSEMEVDLQKEILCKSEKWKIQLKQCRDTEHQRVTFGKSGIHGWGLFALVNHPQDTMIIEYKGEIVTPAVADMREQLYRTKGMDCYLFHVTDTFIIDATVRGAIGRFINHCCAPSMYAKSIQVEGKNHLCFFARYNIKAGQELTYDYRFKEELAEHKLPCHCGAPNCRGYLN